MTHDAPVAKRIATLSTTIQPFMRFFNHEAFARMMGDPNVSNFAVGNPHEMPLPAFIETLQKWSVPQNKDWYAYKFSEPNAQQVVANSLRYLRGVPFEPQDIAMTDGGFAAIKLALDTVVNPGDEVIFITPPWFFYELLITGPGGVPVRAKIDADTFDLDLDSIEAAITDKTRAIIINSPNNPTGKIYPRETLKRLADILTTASERNGRAIYLLSDEAYNRIVYDGLEFTTPASVYPNTFVLYTYGKTLLTPGQRLGYIALPPTMPERETIRQAIMVSQLVGGHAVPNALLQHALGDLERLSIDIEHLQYKRDWLVGELRDMGYDIHSPEGTFYLLPRSPIENDWQFAEILGEHNILCLPGTIVEMPGYFRLSLTANDEMIEQSLPNFKAALETATG
jgi:aspartate aminotransferase